MRGNVTMRDIAERMGVSTVTVSKALNDKEGVSEEVKRRIKETAKEMGYRFNTHAKAIREGLAYNIGIIIPEKFGRSTQSFYLKFYQYLSQNLDIHRYTGILHILSTEEEKQQLLPRIFTEKKIDGYILLGQVGPDYVKVIEKTGAPLIFLDFYTNRSDIASVVTDNFFGVYELTNHLISLGHKEIAFVGNIRSTSSIQDRFLGYCKSLLEHFLPIKDQYVVKDRDEKGTYIPLELPDPLPTAFVCNCDEVAFILMNDLKKKGIRIPEDCSIVGFDNDIYAELAEPHLTTVEVNMPEMSRTAVKILLEKIKDVDTEYGRVLIPGNLKIRESAAANN